MGLIYNRLSYFGAHSGWPALLGHLQRRVDCQRLLAPWPIGRFEHRLLDRAVRPRDVPWYNLEALGWELAGARQLATRRSSICHFLYAEGSYHYLGRLRARVRGLPGRIVCSLHQPPVVFERHIGRRTRLDLADAVIVQASTQADHLSSVLDDERLFVVPHGVDADFFRPAPPGRAASMRLVCVGSWLRDFSTLRLVALRAQREEPELHITVIADPRRAQEVAGLRNVEVLSGISDQELLSSYHGAAGLILPLLDTTANNGLLEAMACGLPVVATRVGGVLDYVDEAGALVVGPHDPDAMLRAALALVRDPGRAANMGARNRRRALAFGWEHVADMLVEVYERAMARPPAGHRRHARPK